MVKSGVWKPSSQETQKKIGDAGLVTNLKLASGSGAAVVAFYDGISEADVTEANLKWVLDASTTDADQDSFDKLKFNKGIYAVCEQGADTNPRVCVAVDVMV